MGTDPTPGSERLVFVIQIRGTLDQSWSSRLGGMTTVACGTEEAPETTLIGPLPDQATLFRVLTTLYDNRLPLLYLRSFPSS